MGTSNVLKQMNEETKRWKKNMDALIGKKVLKAENDTLYLEDGWVVDLYFYECNIYRDNTK